ncbi:hypothetical protein ACLVWU_14145 [Bdellovibrio sp. HCB290]|uniref:hypothetical protein n=1 Tax=Bdellovibrio sp. HCB290 TaxID=3394356 RepID=UPI0039B497BB
MLKKLILALTVLSLAACAFNNDDNGSDNFNKKLNDDNQRSAEIFRKVEGSYQGNMIRENGATEIVQISLLLLNINTGTNTDGSAKIQHMQKAAYTRVSPASAPLTDMDVAYVPETGTLNILNSKAVTNDDVQSIIATVQGGVITGTVKSRTGIIGRISLKFIIGGSSNDGNGSDEQYYNRLREQYTAISGTYLGCVISTKEVSQRIPSYKGKIKLSIFEQKVGTNPADNTTIPTLVGSFTRNYDKNDFLKADLSGIYRSDFVPATLSLTGTYPAQNNGYSTVFKGTLANGEYTADFMNAKGGIEGQMYFKKGQNYPAKCANVSR